VTFFDFFQVLGPESFGEHRLTSIVGVLRLRAINPLLSDRSARRFAQDDGLVGILKNLLVGCTKTTKIKKVKSSQDDGLVGVLNNSLVGRDKNAENQKSHDLSG
jgi:hypothetical protein